MSKYLELVEGSFTQEHLDKQKNQKPYVAYSIKDDKVIYTIVSEPVVYDPWVTFIAEEANSTIGLKAKTNYQNLWYSVDGEDWISMTTSTTITLSNTGDKVYIRGKLLSGGSSWNWTQFKMSGKIAASGNCNALWNYEDLDAPLKDYCGNYLFRECKSLVAAPELPATTLSVGCYQYMFMGTSITTAPALPATELTRNCYKYMFYDCNKLSEAPELTANVLTNNCYDHMFFQCYKLDKLTCLATDISADTCVDQWVNYVSSTGTFIKHPDMTSWPSGASGIPSGWTVEDAVL